MLFVYMTGLLLATLTSAKAAKAVESETPLSLNAVNETSLNSSKPPSEPDETTLKKLHSDVPSLEVKAGEAKEKIAPMNAISSELGSQPVEPSNIGDINTAPALAPKTPTQLNQFPHTPTEAEFLSQTVQPQTAPPPPAPVNPETAQTSETTSSLRLSPRIGGQFTTGPGVGYESSFGSIEGFVPLSQSSGSRLTFLEGRLSLSTEKSLVSGNVVLGHRFYSPNANRIFGGYIAYDARDTGKSSFNQIGAGVESLGESFDFRANAYIPVGDTRHLADEQVVNTGTSFSEPFFQSNFLAQTRNLQRQINRRLEAAMTGFDVEAGVKIAQIGETGDLRGYGGLYYYDAPGSSGSVGWRTRLEARPTDSLKLGLAVSNDATFGTNVVLNVGATFPGTRPRGIRPQERVLARLGESVTRNANIVVDEQLKSETSVVQDTVFVNNPTTGQPWRFQHVNLGIGTGNGTFENPTGTVAEALAVAQPNDIVYVQPGTNPGVGAFSIPDQVQVLSTAPVQRINTVESGSVQLPLSGAEVLPTVTDTVTLGNNTTLSGFAIASTTGSGIVGSGISNAIVRDNEIANSARQGILLENVTGEVAIANNSINNSGSEGLSLENNAGQVDLTLSGNTIANNGSSANEGDGVKVELRDSAQGTFNIATNQISNNSGIGGIANGINIKMFNAAQSLFDISNNQITDNQFRGTNIELESTANGTFNLTDNTIANNQADGTYIKLSDMARGTVTLSNNQITNNGIYGVGVSLSNETQGTFNITSNTISDNQDNGVFIQLSDKAQGTANLTNNQEIARNGTYGIFISTNQNAVLRTLIESNNSVDNALSGLSLSSSNSAKIFTGVRLNTFAGGGLSDFEAITTSPKSTICLQPRNNAIGSLVLLDSIGGLIQVEAGTLSTNTISTSNLTNWSGTTVPSGTCGF